MRMGNVGGRPVVGAGDRVVFADQASGGRFGDFAAVFADWPEFTAWARGLAAGKVPPAASVPAAGLRFGPAVPAPRQVLAVGLNYGSHLAEGGAAVPQVPPFFTKFPSSIAGPGDPIELVSEFVDYEVEIVVVIGRLADRIPAGTGWDHVAGLVAGQDISARNVQTWDNFSLAKSFKGYTVLGPWLATPDEFGDRDKIPLSSMVNGDMRQSAASDELILDIPTLVEMLSAVTPLLPGDLLFTGTPGGVGMARRPPAFLQPGDVLTTEIGGFGSFSNPCVACPDSGRLAQWRNLPLRAIGK